MEARDQEPEPVEQRERCHDAGRNGRPVLHIGEQQVEASHTPLKLTNMHTQTALAYTTKR